MLALSVDAAFFVDESPECMDCLLQPANMSLRLTIKIVTGFSIGWNLTVMTDFHEHVNPAAKRIGSNAGPPLALRNA